MLASPDGCQVVMAAAAAACCCTPHLDAPPLWLHYDQLLLLSSDCKAIAAIAAAVTFSWMPLPLPRLPSTAAAMQPVPFCAFPQCEASN
jgi:hypothetical protein